MKTLNFHVIKKDFPEGYYFRMMDILFCYSTDEKYCMLLAIREELEGRAGLPQTQWRLL